MTGANIFGGAVAKLPLLLGVYTSKRRSCGRQALLSMKFCRAGSCWNAALSRGRVL